MPARDLLHDIVRTALIKDGWIITHDPFQIQFGIRKVYVDLGAEPLVAAEKADSKIAVEVKNFLGPSKVTDLERAIGQYVIYQSWLNQTEPERILYLALDEVAYKDLFLDISGQVLVSDHNLKLIVVDLVREEITQWIR